MKYLILIFTIIASSFVSGCSSEPTVNTNKESMEEMCYDGVVYIGKNVGYTNLSVKFNGDSTVATKTFDGKECP